MKIKFPFAINQVSDTEIEVLYTDNGAPLIKLDIAPIVAELLSEKQYDDICAAVVIEIIKQTLQAI